MRKFTLPTPHTVKGGAFDTWRLFENPTELAANPLSRDYERGGEWHGGNGYNARDWAVNGRPEHVAESDRIMTELETAVETIATRRSFTCHDVAGAFPDVPAYLSGSPMAMLRRRRETSNHAPVCVLVDTTISAGISHAVIRRRGAALLAFVRLLSAKRAVELWCGVGTDDNRRNASYVFTRLDTAPLDLSRAAFMLCDTAAVRVLGYGSAGDGFTGKWPYGSGALNVERFTEVAKQAFPQFPDLVAVPGLHLTDPLTKNPVKWIMEKLAQFGETETD